MQKNSKASVWMFCSLQLHYIKTFCGESHMTKRIWLALQQIFQQKQNLSQFPQMFTHFSNMSAVRKYSFVITECIVHYNPNTLTPVHNIVWSIFLV